METWKCVQEGTRIAEAKEERMRNQSIARTFQAITLGVGVLLGTAHIVEIEHALLYVMHNLKLYITFFLFYLFLTIEIWMTTAVRFLSWQITWTSLFSFGLVLQSLV